MKQETRSEQRQIIMIILYQLNIFTKYKIKYDLLEIIKNNVNIESEFIKDTIYGIITHKEEIDKIANDNLLDWTIDRLGFTDRAILRMAIYELLYTETPEIVIINEAVELAKKYSDDDVRKMINATLDNIYHNK